MWKSPARPAPAPARSDAKESILAAPPDEPILTVALRSGFVLLEERPGRELVIGLRVAPEVRGVMNFAVEPDGRGGSRLAAWTTATQRRAAHATLVSHNRDPTTGWRGVPALLRRHAVYGYWRTRRPACDHHPAAPTAGAYAHLGPGDFPRSTSSPAPAQNVQ